MSYLNKKFTLEEVQKLNRDWGRNRIIFKTEILNYVEKYNLKFIVRDTGDADLDGRYCIALPENVVRDNGTIDYAIRTKYNLM